MQICDVMNDGPNPTHHPREWRGPQAASRYNASSLTLTRRFYNPQIKFIIPPVAI